MSEESAKLAKSQSDRTRKPCRILVVDDDRASRDMIMDLLSYSGFQTDGASDGADAWAALRAGNYDLLITDNVMPRITGLELVKLVRAQNADLPVIMATGAIPKDELKRNPGLAINAFLVKPFTADDILGAVNKALHENRQASG